MVTLKSRQYGNGSGKRWIPHEVRVMFLRLLTDRLNYSHQMIFNGSIIWRQGSFDGIFLLNKYI
jgi:hypothetical protein